MTRKDERTLTLKKIMILSAAILTGMALTACTSDTTTKSTSTSSSSLTSNTSSKKAAPKVPTEYTSALSKAKSYATHLNMSKKAVHDQLTSESGERFTTEAANYAMDHLQNVDWNANALKKAKSYQKNMSMSKAAVKDQLTAEAGEKFTPAEAEYAISNLES